MGKVIEITDAKLESMRGKRVTAKELKRIFGYAPTTYINDTRLTDYFAVIQGTFPTLYELNRR